MKVRSMICQVNDSFVNGTNDREAYPKRWVAALVHTNCEKKVATKLEKLGIENYVAIQTEEHQWSDRKKKIDRIDINNEYYKMFVEPYRIDKSCIDCNVYPICRGGCKVVANITKEKGKTCDIYSRHHELVLLYYQKVTTNK